MPDSPRDKIHSRINPPVSIFNLTILPREVRRITPQRSSKAMTTELATRLSTMIGS
jgi:hypothetical protein